MSFCYYGCRMSRTKDPPFLFLFFPPNRVCFEIPDYRLWRQHTVSQQGQSPTMAWLWFSYRGNRYMRFNEIAAATVILPKLSTYSGGGQCSTHLGMTAPSQCGLWSKIASQIAGDHLKVNIIRWHAVFHSAIFISFFLKPFSFPPRHSSCGPLKETRLTFYRSSQELDKVANSVTTSSNLVNRRLRGGQHPPVSERGAVNDPRGHDLPGCSIEERLQGWA